MRYKILHTLALVTLASCTETIYIEKDAEKSTYLNGECKTPIAVGISYNEGSVQTRATRAANGSFTSGDNLIAYVRHVTAEESGTGTSKTYTNIKDVNTGSIVGVGPTMGYLTVSNLNESSKNEADNFSTSGKSKLTVSDKEGKPLYWDDFSNSASDDTDLRTEKHYLQSYYGYCYNGKTGVTENETAQSTGTWLKPSTGELTGWTIETDQNTGTNLTNSDLLWSSSQDPVPYAHAKFNGGVEHGKLTIPYSHAMSKVTIEVNLDKGFGDDVTKNFPATSKVTVKAQTKCIVLAPTSKVTPSTDAADKKGVTMKKGTPEAKKCTFEAIIAPTMLTPVADVATATSAQAFATIEGIDGNKYDIFLTDAIMRPLQTDNTTPKTDAWSNKLAAYNATSVGPESTGYTKDNGGTTIPGVNYKLVVTISKQEIKVVATIADWTTVNAAAEGEINFSTDLPTNPNISGEGKVDFTDGSTIDLYKSSTTEFSTRSTIATYYSSTGKWTCAPIIYWQNANDISYFRALSPSKGTESGRYIIDNKVSMDAGEGTNFDLMWGTTAAHSGTQVNEEEYSYEEGDAINPRTKDVPLIFYHKTSKVKIVLQTPPTDAEGRVIIKDAKIQFTNLYTTNTVNLHTGELSSFDSEDSRSEKVFAESTEDKRPIASTYTPGSAATESNPAVDDKAESSELFMIPQEIPSDDASTANVNEEARLIITLTDGTTYSLALNSCKTVVKDENGNIEKDENGNDKYVAVGQWDEGKSYVYYIRLTKEEILFIALIKDWEEKETNGSATMDWDDVDPDLFEGGLIEKRGDGWKIQ